MRQKDGRERGRKRRLKEFTDLLIILSCISFRSEEKTDRKDELRGGMKMRNVMLAKLKRKRQCAGPPPHFSSPPPPSQKNKVCDLEDE